MAKPIRRIALINFGGLGDGILFLPTLEAVARLCPRAHVTLITEPRCQGLHDILPPGVSVNIIPSQNLSRKQLFWRLLTHLRDGDFDAVVSSGSSPMIALLLLLSGIRVRIGYDSGWLSRQLLSYPAKLDQEQYAAQMHFELAKGFSRVLGVTDSIFDEPVVPHATLISKEPHPPLKNIYGPLIAIHPGVSLASIQKNILKAWPVQNWLALVTKTLDEVPNATVVLLGGPDDEAVITAISEEMRGWPIETQKRVLNLFGETPSVASLARVLAQIDILICVDSAPMHLAIAVGTEIIALFSPTDPEKLIPRILFDRAVYREELSCRPCLFDKRKVSCDAPVCLDIPVEWVWQKLCWMLSHLPPKPIPIALAEAKREVVEAMEAVPESETATDDV